MFTILHVFVDDKFPESAYYEFENDGRVNNKCVIFNLRHVPLKYVGGTTGLVILKSKKEVKYYLQYTDYSMVFFHSLSVWQWFCLKYVPKDKKVIWWSWGFDIYQLPYGLKPFVSVNLYKPLTQKLLKSQLKYRIRNLIESIKWPLYAHKRNTILKRIDYFQPVISLE